MTGNATSLRGALTAAGRDVNTFTKQVHNAGSTGKSTGQILKMGLAVAVLAVGAAMLYGITQAAAFDRELRNVQSITKESDASLQATGKTLISISQRLPQSAKTLAEGLYQISSSGFQGAAGLEILERSAEAASAGLTTTEVSARAITAVLNAYGLEASDAADVSDVLFQTVNLGVVSFEELAGTIGDVVGTAAAATVGIDQVGSAIATMTLSGISASESGTSLNRLMQALIDPSDSLAEAIRGVGYASGAQALQVDSLSEVMEKLRVASGGNIETLLKWFPEIRAARGALSLMSNEGRNYIKVVAGIEDEEARAGATRAALTEQMKAVTAQWELFKNRVNAAAISMGTSLLPTVLTLLANLQSLAALGIDVAIEAFHRLDPFLRSVTSLFGDVVDIAKILGDTFGPVVAGFAALAGMAVITALNALGTALAATSGFLADNETAVKALAIVLGGVFLSSLIASAGATAALVTSWAAWQVFMAGGVIGNAITSITARMAAMRVGMVGLQTAMVTGTGAAGAFRGAINSIGPALGIAVALFAVTKAFEAYGNEVRRATEDGKTWASDFKGNFEPAKASAAELESEIDRLTGASDEMQHAANNALNPFLDDRLKTARDELDATVAPMIEMQDAARRLEITLGITADEALAMASDQEFMAATTDGATGALDEEAAAALHAQESLAALADELKAMYDPIFAVQDSMNKLKDAQQAVTDAAIANSDANKDNNVSAEEVIRLNQEAVKAAVDYQASLFSLKAAVADGSVSLENASATLRQWAADGLITQAQADEAAWSIGVLGGKADDIDGKEAIIDVATHGIPEVESALQRVFRKLQALHNNGQSWVVDIGTVARSEAGMSGRVNRADRRWGAVHSFAAGGITPAHVARGDLIRYAEPETGGEAFIPRLGNRDRSMGILNQAASWYGARVIAMASGGYVQAGATQVAQRNAMAQGILGTQVGATILWAAGGKIPEAQAGLRQVADTYLNIVKEMGEADAHQILWMSTSVEDFNDLANAALEAKTAEDAAREAAAKAQAEMAARHMAINDVKYAIGEISDEDYLAILNKRLAMTSRYSDEWYSIWQEINQITEDQAQEQERILQAHNDELQRQADEMTAIANQMQQEIDGLVSELIGIYQSAQSQFVSQQDAFASAIAARNERIAAETGAFRDSIVQTYRDLSNPVLLFGSNKDVTSGEIERALRHRIKAAAKFGETYKALVARGLDQSILTQLAQSGPESLSLAQALLKVDPALINEAMAATSGVGESVASVALQWEASRIQQQAYADTAIPDMRTFQELLDEEVALWEAKNAEQDVAQKWAIRMADEINPSLTESYRSLTAQIQAAAQAANDLKVAQGGAPAAVLPSSVGGLVSRSFDTGGWLPPGFTLAYNGTGAQERVGGPLVSVGAGAVTIDARGSNVSEASMKQMVDDGFRQLARSLERKVRR
jgi:TP901 family phage tail tape measure protein